MNNPTDTSKAYVTIPKLTELTQEDKELYRLSGHQTVSAELYRTAATITILEAQKLKQIKNGTIDIAWIALTAYLAGKIDGIRQERARRKGNKCKHK